MVCPKMLVIRKKKQSMYNGRCRRGRAQIVVPWVLALSCSKLHAHCVMWPHRTSTRKSTSSVVMTTCQLSPWLHIAIAYNNKDHIFIKEFVEFLTENPVAFA